jgi:hypothetical protein
MVVRGYNDRHEMDAFLSLLKDPNFAPADALADQRGKWKNTWEQHLSVAHWLLVALGSWGVDALHFDDSEALHRLRAQVEQREDLRSLRAVARCEIPWAELFADNHDSPSLDSDDDAKASPQDDGRERLQLTRHNAEKLEPRR